MKFSKKLKLLSLVIMSLSVFFVYKYTNHNNINYTSIGDGFAVGIDCYGRKDYSYADYIKDYLLEKNKLKIYNKTYQQDKMTINELLNTILTTKKMENKDTKNNIIHILRDSDYITLSIGINDLLYKLSLTNDYTEENLDIIIKEIDTTFDELIKEIKKIYNRDIYIIGYYNPPIQNDFIKQAIKKLNNIYKSNDDVIYISTYIISENKNIFLPNSNSYYPNYKGYQVISNKIIDKIAKKLEK